MTPAQQKYLTAAAADDDGRYRFPPGRQKRVAEALESRGYLESELLIASRDHVRGIVKADRAYRITDKGREFVGAAG